MLDPRTERDPVCDCSAPVLSGYTRCVGCEVRVRADNDEPTAARDIGTYGGMTPTEIDGILRESLEYIAWARVQNAKPRCKRCQAVFDHSNRGEWPTSGCCISCEADALRAYVARAS